MTDFIISDEGTIEIYDGKCENPAIRIVNPSEFVENYSHLKEFDLLSQKTKHCTICKSEILKTCIAGTVAVPNPNFPREKIGSFCFIAFYDMLLIIEDKPYAVNLIECDSAETPVGARGIIGILFKLLETIVNGELEFLYNTREELERLEDTVLNAEKLTKKDTTKFEKDFLLYKRKLSVFQSFYEQLVDLATNIEENADIDDLHQKYAVYFEKRIDRYYDSAKELKDYVMQIDDAFKSKINSKQNNIMQVLTVITSIFMPLTLIAGWYGMNFKVMPELAWDNGYYMVIVISVVIIIGELIFFKIKNWF